MSATLFGDEFRPHQVIKVKFRNQEDVDILSERLGLTLVKSIETVKIPGLFTTKNFNTPRAKREPRAKKWEAHWVDMPEFTCIKADTEYYVVFHVELDHIDEMATILDQNLTAKTKSIWFPKLQIGLNSRKRYVDEK